MAQHLVTSTPKAGPSRSQVSHEVVSTKCVGRISSDDFKSVFDKNDVTISSQVDWSDETIVEKSVSGRNEVNSNSHDDSDLEILETTIAPSHPYVPYSVEEVSLVKTLDKWTNLNVRVIGTVSLAKISSDVVSFHSIGEEGGPFSIPIDVKLLKTFPPRNIPLEFFGELQIVKDSDPPTPFILARFFRDFSAVDIFHYKAALEKLKNFVPHFISKRQALQGRPEDLGSEPEI